MTEKELQRPVASWEISKVIPYAKNTKKHPQEQVDKIVASIHAFGFNQPIAVDREGVVAVGHGRLMAAKQLGLSHVPVVVLDDLSEEEIMAYRMADNKLNESEWDTDFLRFEFKTLERLNFDLNLTGFSVDEIKDILKDPEEEGEGIGGGGQSIKLSDKFLVPPFSVLDARQGYWRERKKQWLELGIQSELGREGNLLGMSNTMLEPDPEKRAKMEVAGYDGGNAFSGAGTSIFDPVLCELIYRWFSPPAGNVIDPFAGGSVRGVSAALLGRYYYGGELRAEQVEANRAQADRLCPGIKPIWANADSRVIDETFQAVPADLIFSCPPYADLEVYSDDPKDLSTLDYKEFVEAYREIIRKSVSLLKPNRFAVFVVGEVREKGKGGFYKNFVLDTIDAFEAAGARYYNEIVLLTSAGTLALRAGRTFSATRKIGKTHQNVLVFCKGDPREATSACGQIEISNECFEGFDEQPDEPQNLSTEEAPE